MAAIKQLAAVTRSGTGKGAARSVRREGRVPAVIYGGGLKPEPISVDFKDVNKLIYAGHFLTTIFELDIDGRKERVLPRDYQLDVVTDRPVHVDFLRLRPGSRVRIGVPVHVENREASPGIKKGGTVNLVLHTRRGAGARPTTFPRRSRSTSPASTSPIRCTSRRSKLPEGCKAVSSKSDLTVVTIVPPTVMCEETPPRRRRGRRRACAARGSRQGRRSGQGRAPPAPQPPPSPPARSKARAPSPGFRARGRGSRASDSGAPCSSSRNSAIRARRTRATATTSASWRSRRSPRAHRFGPFRARFSGLASEGTIGGERVLLLAPQTYMNKSGRSVGEALRFHKLDLARPHRPSRRTRPRARQGPGQGRRRRRRPQRPALDHRPCRQRLPARPARHRPSRRQGARAQFRARATSPSRRRPGWTPSAARSPTPRRCWSKVEDASFQNKVHLALEAAGFGEKAPT